MSLQLPTDADTNGLFERAAKELCVVFRYPAEEATRLTRDYYASFRDPRYCEAIGIPVQDDDFFHHEAPGGLALRIHYYLGLKGDPDPGKFVEWRAGYNRQRRFTSVALTIARQFARQEYKSIVESCTHSNLGREDLEQIVRSYDGTLTQPPDDAYDHLAAEQVEVGRRPSWRLRVPLWTVERGPSELTLVLRVSLNGLQKEVVLEGLSADRAAL